MGSRGLDGGVTHRQAPQVVMALALRDGAPAERRDELAQCAFEAKEPTGRSRRPGRTHRAHRMSRAAVRTRPALTVPGRGSVAAHGSPGSRPGGGKPWVRPTRI